MLKSMFYWYNNNNNHNDRWATIYNFVISDLINLVISKMMGILGHFGVDHIVPSWYWTGKSWIRCISNDFEQKCEKRRKDGHEFFAIVTDFEKSRSWTVMKLFSEK